MAGYFDELPHVLAYIQVWDDYMCKRATMTPLQGVTDDDRRAAEEPPYVVYDEHDGCFRMPT